jgi:acyl-CoA thioesterase
VEVRERGEGFARVALRAEERHLNAHGTVHGGAIATLVDVSMGEAVGTTTAGGERPVTIEIKVNYLEPGAVGALVCSAEIRKRGSRFTVIGAEVVQQDGGEVLAEAIGTFTTVG